MPLRILHFSITPLAGQPYRLVKALQRHSNCEVHLIDLDHWNIYPQDIVFSQELERCIDLAKKTDIIHLHNYLDLNSTEFLPIRFDELKLEGKSIIRQMHSEPSLIAKKMNISIADVLDCPLPTLVISQFQERYYKNAYVVANNIPIFDTAYMPDDKANRNDIIFSPTSSSSAWEKRWNTKGAPETIQLLKTISKSTGASFEVITNSTLNNVLTKKKISYIVLDDMVTGSFHLSGLEGVSLAKPTLTYLDDRTKHIMMEISGASSLPFINIRLEDALPLIKYLLANRDEGEELGQFGRQWIENYWNEEIIINQYIEVYDKLLQNPNLLTRQKNLKLEDKNETFFALTLPDLIYESRKTQATNQYYIISKFLNLISRPMKNNFDKLIAKLKREFSQVIFKK
jgi:hypothetical protein